MVTLHDSSWDKVIWKWTEDQCFSTLSTYRAFFIDKYEILGAKILWKMRAPGKCKFFVWLALHGHCWTAARRKRHNLQDDDSCILCGQEPKTINHLVVNCSYTKEVWHSLLSQVNWQALTPSASDRSLAGWWTSSRKHVDKVVRKSFDSMVILTS